MSEEDEFPQPAPLAELPAADVQAPGAGEGNNVTYTYPIHQPEEEFNDFQVGVRASVLRRTRVRLIEIIDQSFSVHEVLLGASSVSIGAVLSAIVSGTEMASWQGFVFYVLLPMIAVGTGVAYIMQRNSGNITSKRLAREALESLPDPDRAVEVRKQ